MQSPLPGMDPYLEHPGYWLDFHRRFITYLRDAILDRLHDPYDARINEQVRRTHDDIEHENAEIREVWIEIRHLPDQSVVTIIEVLSPSNKIGEGYLEYRAKRSAILNRPVSLVSIDLLLTGRRLDLGPLTPRSSYATFVSRAKQRKTIDVYAWDLRSPLPPIPIPLRPPDPDIVIPLAEVFAITYQRGHYARALRYQNPAAAPLSDAQIQWAQQLLTQE